MIRVQAVVFLSREAVRPASALARELDLPAYDLVEQYQGRPKEFESALCERMLTSEEANSYAFLLDHECLQIAQINEAGVLKISGDFLDPTLNFRRTQGGGKRQMIAKAIGLSGHTRPHVLDATAGLGRDAFILASLGCSVQMLERVPEVRMLLRYALRAASSQRSQPMGADFASTIDRMRLVEADAREFLVALPQDSLPDVIYLDPMFPHRSKSALVKKEMRVFQDLVGEDLDAVELLEAALDSGAKRVVVKRPRIAEYLGGHKPSHELAGKRNRFDVYL